MRSFDVSTQELRSIGFQTGCTTGGQTQTTWNDESSPSSPRLKATVLQSQSFHHARTRNEWQKFQTIRPLSNLPDPRCGKMEELSRTEHLRSSRVQANAHFHLRNLRKASDSATFSPNTMKANSKWISELRSSMPTSRRAPNWDKLARIPQMPPLVSPEDQICEDLKADQDGNTEHKHM